MNTFQPLKVLLWTSILLLAGAAFLQAQPVYNAKPAMELSMPGNSGRNGASVAWNPQNNCYYSAFAGNATFPLAVFNSSGSLIDETEPGFDVRGLWYNKKTKQIEGNGYYEAGIWALLIPSGSVQPSGIEQIFSGMNQPNDNAVGVMDNKGKEIFYWDGEVVVRYNRKTGTEKGMISLDLEEDEYNASAMVFTGIKGKEIGLLDYNNGEIELYGLKGGNLAGKVRLPYEAPLPDRFNFAYANGIFWLFDIEARTWRGYKAMIE